MPCEKGHIAGEQSGRNWGWVRQQGRDAREMPMIIESLNIWRGLAEVIGKDIGFEQTRCLYAARTDDELEGYASWQPAAREHGLDTRRVSDDEVAQLAPGATGTWIGGICTASDGQAEPHKAAPAIARASSTERRIDPHSLADHAKADVSPVGRRIYHRPRADIRQCCGQTERRSGR